MEGFINIMPYRLAENEIRDWLTIFPLSIVDPKHVYMPGEMVVKNGRQAILEPFCAISNSHDVMRNTFLNTAHDVQAMVYHLVFQIGQNIKGKEDVIIRSYPFKPKDDMEGPNGFRKSIVRRNQNGVWYTITQERDHWDYQFIFRVLLGFWDFVY